MIKSDTIELNFGDNPAFLNNANDTFETVAIELRALLIAVCDSRNLCVNGFERKLSHCV